MAKKSYTAEQAEEFYERGCREVTSDDWYKNMWAIDEIIRREVKAMMCVMAADC